MEQNRLVTQDCQLPPQFLSNFQDFWFCKTAKVYIISYAPKFFYITQFLRLQVYKGGYKRNYILKIGRCNIMFFPYNSLILLAQTEAPSTFGNGARYGVWTPANVKRGVVFGWCSGSVFFKLQYQMRLPIQNRSTFRREGYRLLIRNCWRKVIAYSTIVRRFLFWPFFSNAQIHQN